MLRRSVCSKPAGVRFVGACATVLVAPQRHRATHGFSTYNTGQDIFPKDPKSGSAADEGRKVLYGDKAVMPSGVPDAPPTTPYWADGKMKPTQPVDTGYPNPKEPKGESDNIKNPEFDTIFGKFEMRPTGTGSPADLRYHNVKRTPPGETYLDRDVRAHWPVHQGHHPYFDYSNRTGNKEGYAQPMAGGAMNWQTKSAIFALYKAAVRSIPLIKQYYWLNLPIERMQERIKAKFYQNKFVKDPDAIKHLLHCGWMDYQECIAFRKTRGGMMKFFHDSEDQWDMIKTYTDQEGQNMEERRIWQGEEQRKEGPYDGFWSWVGQKSNEEFSKLAGRVPMSWTASKGYFELWKCDGTNYYEKNMDYEGWYIKNVDPDRRQARREIQSWTEAGYQQPKHYAGKNRRAYRRFVKDMEGLLNNNSIDSYLMCREQFFQYSIREMCPESNRIHAEKKLARNDDLVFTTQFDEPDKIFKQAMREFPNPRLWKTDAFYLRLKYLLSPLEYNWAKAPIGVALEKAYNEFISDDVTYTISSSPQFADIKADKKRNPMAKTWADFYTEFDPDVPATRRLPWYHADFNYDRRVKWDERCMRYKKWVQAGDVDFIRPFFDAYIFEWEQLVNRPEIARHVAAVEKKYCAPRMVQLYRSLNRRMDMALISQLRDFMIAKQTLVLPPNSASFPHGAGGVEATKKALAASNFKDFVFDVPPVIFPDNVEQPALLACGSPRPPEKVSLVS